MIVTTGPKTSWQGHLGLPWGPGDHRRLDHGTSLVAAGEHLGAEPAGLLDPVEDPLSRFSVDHGADVRLLVGRVADHELRDRGTKAATNASWAERWT